MAIGPGASQHLTWQVIASELLSRLGR